MANHLAVAATCEAVLQLLRMHYQPQQFGQVDLEFRTYLPQDFTSPMQAGVSLFLYRIELNGAYRNQPGRGGRQRSSLPLELHFLLTAWAKEATLQATIAGWMMRCLEETPVLTASLLNAVWSATFRSDETVEVVPADMPVQDQVHLMGRLSETGYPLSVPYLARLIYIDTERSS